MFWSFRNKLKTLTDKEFLEYLKNRDSYSGKDLSLIDQEARYRFFSNKHFNGDEDEYINPNSKYYKASVRRNIYINSGIAVTIVVIFLAVYFVLIPTGQQNHWFAFVNDGISSVFNDKTLHKDMKLIADSKLETGDSKKEDFKKKGIGNVVPEVLPEDKGNASEYSEKTPIPAGNNTANDVKVSKKDISTEIPATNVPAGKNDISKVSTEKAEKTETQKSGNQGVPDHKRISQSAENAAKEPVKSKDDFIAEPAKELLTAVQTNNIKNDGVEYTDVSELNTSLLRQFIPFLNDWAFKQTKLGGISDYYVENNHFINFRLAEGYADSLEIFQKVKASQFIENYKRSLKSNLGETFPTIDIEIKFVKHNTEL